MGFPRQEYWSALLFLPPECLPDPGIEPVFPVSTLIGMQVLFFFFFFDVCKAFNFIFKLYIIVLVLPNIKMNPWL